MTLKFVASIGFITKVFFRALLHGRVHVSSDDIRAMVLPALRHRVLLNFEGEAEQVDPDNILRDILSHVSEQGQ